MAIAFAYTEATNIVVLTGGTAGVPATFADFVTADRAGADTSLLSAGAPANNLALTYAVRPVEDLAVLVKCIVANKTAEADFIFITGKDWRGAAQTESIDVTAGNGSYTSTKYWSEITTLDCSDNAAGGGVVWGDGDLSVTQDVWGVIWDYGGGQHRLDAKLHIGNDVASTYFADTNKQINFDSTGTGADIYTHYNANFRLGTLVSDALRTTKDGCHVVKNSSSNYMIEGDGASASINLYSSIFTRVSGGSRNYGVAAGTQKIYNCQFNEFKNISCWAVSLTSYNVLVSDSEASIENANATLNLKSLANKYGITFSLATNAQSRDVIIKGSTTSDVYIWGISGSPGIIDGDLENWDFTWLGGVSAGACYRKYSCNIHVADKDGVNLAGVSVACEDKNANVAFATQTTAANGTITEQIMSRGYYNQVNGDTLQDYSPHKFTISKAGYETLVLDNVTVDAPVAWHLEMQPLRARTYGRGHRHDVKQFI